MTQNGKKSTTPERSNSLRQPSAFSKFKRRFSRPREPRIVFLGSCEVGKTALITRLRADVFPHAYEPTVHESLPYFMRLRSTLAETVQFVDVTGALGREYASIRAATLEEGDGFVVVFSVKSRTSFERVNGVLEEISQRKSWSKDELGLRTMLVGNQAHEEGFLANPDDDGSLVGMEETLNVNAPREVTSAEAWSLASRYGITEYVETSALTALGVDSIPRRLGTLFGAYATEERKVALAPRSRSLSQRVRNFLARPVTTFEDSTSGGKKSKTPSPTHRAATHVTSDANGSTPITAGLDSERRRHHSNPDCQPRIVSPGPSVATARSTQSHSKTWRRSLFGTSRTHNDMDIMITSPMSDDSFGRIALGDESRLENSGHRVRPPSATLGRRSNQKKGALKDDAVGRYYGGADPFWVV